MTEKANFYKRRTSIFAFASFVMYVITLAINATRTSKGVEVKILNATIQDMPNLWLVMNCFFLVIGIRLYLHAWAIDETTMIYKIKNLSQDWQTKLLMTFEWWIRLIWVVMVTCLPLILLRKLILPILNWQIQWGVYITVTFALILLWDVLMINKTIACSNYTNVTNEKDKAVRIRDLKIVWFLFDIIILLLIAGLSAIWMYMPMQNGYKVPLIFICISAAGALALLQIIIWGFEITKSSSLIKIESGLSTP